MHNIGQSCVGYSNIEKLSDIADFTAWIVQ
jgi:hypothetical protein